MCFLNVDRSMFNNLGFTWFKEERAYAAAMSARSVPVALEHLVRELTFLNMGNFTRVLSTARALQVLKYVVDLFYNLSCFFLWHLIRG